MIEPLAPGRRHLVVLAHQDDEAPYAGALQRMLPNARVVFVTNGDGLAPSARTPPDLYAAARRAESTAALKRLGYDEAAIAFLGFSELTLYARFAAMLGESPRAPVGDVFEQVAAAVGDEIERYAPDVVWTLAWQGGHPEHDLTHLAVVRALAARAAATGVATPLYEFPAYELIVVAFRFRPWDRRARMRIRLTAGELDAKREILALYPTQRDIVDQFRRIVGVLGASGRLIGRGFTLDDYFVEEEFAEVGPRDYTRSTHVSSRLDYPFDDYEGTPIRFDATLRRIAAAWGLGGPAPRA